MIPIYVINLDRSPDRLEAITANLERIGLDAHRISAVDAREHSITGERACALSHCKALVAFLATPYPAALILEDDAEVASDTRTLLESVDWWPSGVDVVKLENAREKPRYLGSCRGRTPTGRILRTIANANDGSCGYLVNRKGARILLETEENTIMPMDRLLFDLRASKTARRLRPVQIVPCMVRQRVWDFASDLEESRQEEEMRGAARVGWKRRPVATLSYKAGVLLLRLVGIVRRRPVPWSDTPPSTRE